MIRSAVTYPLRKFEGDHPIILAVRFSIRFGLLFLRALPVLDMLVREAR